MYSLVAKATDGGGQSCQADVTLQVEDVNDNAPRFFPSHCAVAVFDNTTIKTPVAVVLARDPDQGENRKAWKPFAHGVTLSEGLALCVALGLVRTVPPHRVYGHLQVENIHKLYTSVLNDKRFRQFFEASTEHFSLIVSHCHLDLEPFQSSI